LVHLEEERRRRRKIRKRIRKYYCTLIYTSEDLKKEAKIDHVAEVEEEAEDAVEGIALEEVDIRDAEEEEEEGIMAAEEEIMEDAEDLAVAEDLDLEEGDI